MKWRLMMVVAAALSVTACKDRSAEQSGEGAQAQVDRFQQKSEDAFDRAKEVQNKAEDEQKQAVNAREDVQSAQQDLQESQQQLSEAQAKAQQESQQAMSAQQQAQQETQAAQQEASQAQQQAAQAQQQEQEEFAQRQQAEQPAQAGTGGSGTTVEGTVAKSEENALVVQTQSGGQVRVDVRPETEITLDGRRSSMAEIPEGAQIRASFADQGQVARIDVTTSGQQQGVGGAGQSGSMEEPSSAEPQQPAPQGGSGY